MTFEQRVSFIIKISTLFIDDQRELCPDNKVAKAGKKSQTFAYAPLEKFADLEGSERAEKHSRVSKLA